MLHRSWSVAGHRRVNFPAGQCPALRPGPPPSWLPGPSMLCIHAPTAGILVRVVDLPPSGPGPWLDPPARRTSVSTRAGAATPVASGRRGLASLTPYLLLWGLYAVSLWSSSTSDSGPGSALPPPIDGVESVRMGCPDVHHTTHYQWPTNPCRNNVSFVINSSGCPWWIILSTVPQSAKTRLEDITSLPSSFINCAEITERLVTINTAQGGTVMFTTHACIKTFCYRSNGWIEAYHNLNKHDLSSVKGLNKAG